MRFSLDFAKTTGYTQDQILDFLADFQNRVDQLEKQARQQDRTIVGLQNELIRASKFTHEDSEKRLDGIQILLGRAGEYRGREKKSRRG